MKFTDGVEIKTSGPLRKAKYPDGWYVVGNGMCIPCDNEAEANEILEEMKTYETV